MTTPGTAPDTRAILRRVKRLEISTNRLVEGLLTGAFHSVFRGRGIEFHEVREYVPGDDVRAIDWNVTARMDAPYVKSFIEERDLTVLLLLDVSASGRFGRSRPKQEVQTELAASLMFAAMRNHDRVGMALFSDRVERFIPPRRGKRHMLALVRELLVFEPASRATALAAALRFASKVAKKRAIVFVLSDFLDEAEYMTPLRLLAGRHDVIAIRLVDPRERMIPPLGLIELEDEETGEQLLVDTSSRAFQAAFQRNLEAQDLRVEATMRRLNLDAITVRTDEPFERPLRAFFRMRARRLHR